MVEALRVAQVGVMQVEAARLLIAEALLDMHPAQVVVEHPLTRHPVGHHRAEFGWLSRLGRRPGDRQVAAPVGVLGQAHVGEVAALPGRDAELVERNLPAIGEGNQGGVGQADHVAPAQRNTELGPLAAAEAAVGKKGHAARMLEQLGDIVQHPFADFGLDIALARDDFPGQRKGAEAMRERQAKHLQGLVADKTAIENDRDLTRAPGVQHLANERVVQNTRLDRIIGQPASDTRDAASFFGRSRDVQGQLTQMDALCLHQRRDDPDPVPQAAPVEIGVNRLQLRRDLRVYFLAAAHRVAFLDWCGNLQYATGEQHCFFAS